MRPELVRELDQRERRILELIGVLEEELKALARILIAEGEDAAEFFLMGALPRVVLYFLLPAERRREADRELVRLFGGGAEA